LSSYRVAIDHTTQTIDRRAKHFRNLIVAVTFIDLGSILWAGIAWSWFPLAGIFLLIPFCGLYFFIDEKLLSQWQHGLFAQWEKSELDFSALHEAVTSISTLPKNTVESMLETLPSAGELVAEQSVSSSTRRAIVAVVIAIHACRADSIAFKTAGYSIAGGVILVAVLFRMWQPILGLFVVILVFLLRRWVKAQRLLGARERIINVQQKPDFSLEKFLKIVNQVNWSPIPTKEREKFLAGLSGAT
jgi:hypothetical protein